MVYFWHPFISLRVPGDFCANLVANALTKCGLTFVVFCVWPFILFLPQCGSLFLYRPTSLESRFESIRSPYPCATHGRVVAHIRENITMNSNVAFSTLRPHGHPMIKHYHMSSRITNALPLSPSLSLTHAHSKWSLSNAIFFIFLFILVDIRDIQARIFERRREITKDSTWAKCSPPCHPRSPPCPPEDSSTRCH